MQNYYFSCTIDIDCCVYYVIRTNDVDNYCVTIATDVLHP